MLGRIYRKCRSMIKEPALDFIYKTLMSPAKHFAGRKLFDDLELRRVHKALLSQNLFGIDGKLVPEFEREFAKA